MLSSSVVDRGFEPRSISEVQEMEENLPKTCKVNFEDPNTLHKFTLIITPDEGFWHGGRFKFTLNIPDEYNILVCYIDVH
jgi:ubiquitin-conjugating enzyme E2 F